MTGMILDNYNGNATSSYLNKCFKPYLATLIPWLIKDVGIFLKP